MVKFKNVSVMMLSDNWRKEIMHYSVKNSKMIIVNAFYGNARTMKDSGVDKKWIRIL
jgi:hypothetical protein